MTFSDAAMHSCARGLAVRDGILASSSLDDPATALTEMLLVAQGAMEETRQSAREMASALAGSQPVTIAETRMFEDVLAALSAEASYLCALVAFLAGELSPPSTLTDQRASIAALCQALREME